jgi:leader peptidase (prepilin peptidase)/N-methyltransferase
MSGAELVFIGLLGLVLVPIAVIDARERRIPNWLTLALALLGFAHAWLLEPGWRAALLGGAITVALLAASVLVMRLLSRRAQIGLGDLKFLAASSLWVGWDGSIAVLFVASLLATLTTFALAPWQGLNLGQMRPFGPMLALGMLAVACLLSYRHGGMP